MFFDDPVAALGNIGRGLRKDGRLAFVCWQERGRNPWMGIPVAAALQHVPPPPPQAPDAPGPWAFADRDRLAAILDAAGFADVTIESVEHDLLVGGAADLDAAVGFSIDSGSMRSLLGDIDEGTRAARGRLDPGRVRAVRHLRRGADPLRDLGRQRATGGLVTETHLHRRQRVMGALVGAIVGDALAAPFAAEPPGAFTARFPRPVLTGHGEMLDGGRWTEHTQMMLRVAESLIDAEGLSEADLEARASAVSPSSARFRRRSPSRRRVPMRRSTPPSGSAG